jgi:hypothetical protein
LIATNRVVQPCGLPSLFESPPADAALEVPDVAGDHGHEHDGAFAPTWPRDVDLADAAHAVLVEPSLNPSSTGSSANISPVQAHQLIKRGSRAKFVKECLNFTGGQLRVIFQPASTSSGTFPIGLASNISPHQPALQMFHLFVGAKTYAIALTQHIQVRQKVNHEWYVSSPGRSIFKHIFPRAAQPRLSIWMYIGERFHFSPDLC